MRRGLEAGESAHPRRKMAVELREEHRFGKREQRFRAFGRSGPDKPVMIPLRQQGERAVGREPFVRDAVLRNVAPDLRDYGDLLVIMALPRHAGDGGAGAIGDGGEPRENWLLAALAFDRRVSGRPADGRSRNTIPDANTCARKRRIERGLQRAIADDITQRRQVVFAARAVA